jgi:hypothetical protein
VLLAPRYDKAPNSVKEWAPLVVCHHHRKNGGAGIPRGVLDPAHETLELLGCACSWRRFLPSARTMGTNFAQPKHHRVPTGTSVEAGFTMFVWNISNHTHFQLVEGITLDEPKNILY